MIGIRQKERVYLFCSAVGIGVEYIGILTGIFHYKNGYKITYS
jgi:hypothetical protein